MAKKHHMNKKEFTIYCSDAMIRRVIASNYFSAKLDLKKQGFNPINLIKSSCYF